MRKILISPLLVMLVTSPVLHASNDEALDQELKWLQAEKLGSMVEVVSKQNEDKNTAAGIVTIISRDDIEHYGGNNLFEILNRVPSINMLGTPINPKGVVSMRGDFSATSAFHTLILMNGRPIRDSSFGGVLNDILQSFPIHHLKQIEIIRGPGSVLYGTNAYSCVINLVTVKKNGTAMTLRGRYGSYTTGQIENEFSLVKDDVSVTGAVRYRNSAGSQYSVRNPSGTQINQSLFRAADEDTSASLTASWQDFSLNGFVSQIQQSVWGPSQASNGSPLETQRLFLDLAYKKTVNPHWTSQWNFTYNQYSDKQNVPAPADFVHGTFTHTADNSVLFEQTQFLNFFDKKLNAIFGGLIEWQSGRINQATLGATLPQYSHLRSSIYGEISYDLLQDLSFVHHLKLTLGGQWHRFYHLEKTSFVTADADVPVEGKVGRLGLVYEITPTLGFKVLYSQAFRTASAFNYEINATIIRGDRNLQPEHVETTDIQLFYHNPNYQVALTAFRSRQANLITLSRGLLLSQYINSGTAIYKGLELETKASLGHGLQWQGAYTFQTNYDGNGQNNISPLASHLVKVGLSYDVTKNLQTGAFYTFASHAKTYPNQTVLNPLAGSDHLLSLNANYNLDSLLGFDHSKHLQVSFYVDNLLNEQTYYPTVRSPSFNSFPGNPGRTLFGEVALSF